MSQRKHLLREIDALAHHLDAEKNALSSHQHYFSGLVQRHPSFLLTMLLPAFLLGWRQARNVPKGKRIRGFARFLLSSAFTNLRKQVLP